MPTWYHQGPTTRRWVRRACAIFSVVIVGLIAMFVIFPYEGRFWWAPITTIVSSTVIVFMWWRLSALQTTASRDGLEVTGAWGVRRIDWDEIENLTANRYDQLGRARLLGGKVIQLPGITHENLSDLAGLRPPLEPA